MSTGIKRQLMAEQWDQFARLVMPQNAPVDQRRDIRRAFYAGAHSIFLRVIAEFAPESEPTAEDLQMMTDLEQELKDFAKAIQEGRA